MASSAQATYGIIYQAARQGQAKDYFEEVYDGMVPRAKGKGEFLEYIDSRKDMYLHYGWGEAHAETNAVLDGIDALMDSLAQRRVLRFRRN